MKNIIEGSGITHRWPLNIEDVHEIEDDQFDIVPGDFAGFWDLDLPDDGNCWVLSSITVSFDTQPLLPGMLWVDSLIGTYIWWNAFVGQTPAALGLPMTQGPYKFHFRPAIKFPVNQDVAINYIGADAAVIMMISWECWQEAESV